MSETGRRHQPGTAHIPTQRGPAAPPAPLPPESFSPLAKFGISTVAACALAWFLISWLVLGSPLTDAIGETVGSLAVVLLVVSIVGVARA